MPYKKVVCRDCKGSGKSSLLDAAGTSNLPCPTCSGAGKRREWFETRATSDEALAADAAHRPSRATLKAEAVSPPDPPRRRCTNCGGVGQEKCVRCDGTGTVVQMVGGPVGSLLPTVSWTTTCVECSGRRMMTCRVCRGTGTLQPEPPRGSGQACPECGGSRRVRCSSYLCRGSGSYMGPMGVVVCAMCGGSGRMPCDRCR
jgi:DnaJ-class molecular chaperone